MPNQQTQTQEKEKPVTLVDKLVQASEKEMEKQVKEQTAQRLQSGQSPTEILQGLMQSIGGGQQVNQQDLMGQLEQLSKSPVGTGEKEGLLWALLGGRGLNPQETQEPLGMGKAIQVMGLQQQIEKDVRGIPQEKIDLLNKIVTLAKETGNKELLSAMQEFISGTPKPVNEEAVARGRSMPDVPTDMIGETGTGTGISKDGFYETDPMTGKLTPQAEMRQLEMREKISAETKAMTAQQVDLSNKESNFLRAVTGFERAMAQLKGGMEENAAGGLMQGLYGDMRIFLKRPGTGRAKAFDAQVNETALSLNNILTGQNRVIKGVVEMIKSTFPTRKDPPDVIAQLFTQSIENAYGINKAFEKAGFTPEKIKNMTGTELDNIDVRGMVNRVQLTPEETAEREIFVNRVLNTSPAPKRTIGTVNKQISTIDSELNEINKQLSQMR